LLLAALAFVAAARRSGTHQGKARGVRQARRRHPGQVKQGIIEIGYNEDMVYMALGRPEKIKGTSQREPAVSVSGGLLYNNLLRSLQRKAACRASRSIYFDPYIRAYRRLLPAGFCRHIRQGEGRAHPVRVQGWQGERSSNRQGLRPGFDFRQPIPPSRDRNYGP